MRQMLTFLHTSSTHIPTFDRLLAELAPDVPARHVVHENLLQEAREVGGVTVQLKQKVQDALLSAMRDDTRVALCTCSTLGGCAEEIGQHTAAPILRVDRPMAELAVALGSCILVAATVASTLAPTKALLLDAAQRAHKSIQIIEVLCESAWAKFLQGDQAGYLHDIAAQLRQYAPLGEGIVLAQASMAEAAALCTDLATPILSSPRLGLEAALRVYHGA